MCSRFGVHLSESQLELVFGIEPAPTPLLARDDVRPTDPALTVISGAKEVSYQELRWGLVPSWSTDAKRAANLINARCETVLEKPSFRTAMSKRRCVVPVSWYTEWRQESDPVEIDLFGDAVKPQKPKNVKYGFSLSGVDVTCLAGLYDSWANPDGEVLRTFTILTCEPNALTVEFHHRMPCLLDPDMVPRWLDPKVSSTEAAELLGPIDAVRMTYFAI